MSSRKNTPNLQLKGAIVATGRKQGEIAKSLGIGEVRMSAIVCGRQLATPDERRAIAAAVRKAETDIFNDNRERTEPTPPPADHREGERRAS